MKDKTTTVLVTLIALKLIDIHNMNFIDYALIATVTAWLFLEIKNLIGGGHNTK